MKAGKTKAERRSRLRIKRAKLARRRRRSRRQWSEAAKIERATERGEVNQMGRRGQGRGEKERPARGGPVRGHTGRAILWLLWLTEAIEFRCLGQRRPMLSWTQRSYAMWPERAVRTQLTASNDPSQNSSSIHPVYLRSNDARRRGSSDGGKGRVRQEPL